MPNRTSDIMKSSCIDSNVKQLSGSNMLEDFISYNLLIGSHNAAGGRELTTRENHYNTDLDIKILFYDLKSF